MALFSRTPRPSAKNSQSQAPRMNSAVSSGAPITTGIPAPLVKRLKITPRFFQPKDRLIVAGALVVLVAALVYALISSYLHSTVAVPKMGGTYSEGIVGAPKFINPLYEQTSDADQDLTTLVYSGLMKLDVNYKIAPDLAESFEVSADKKAYTFHLRHNVKWHDGSAFTADDILFTVGAIQNQNYASPLRPSLKDVEVTKIDDSTVKFTLQEPFAPFLSNLTFGILPAHIWENVPPQNAPVVEQNLEPVGTGPFKFKEFKKQKDTGQILTLTLERNSDYYNGVPYIQNLEFHFYQNPDDLIAAFNASKIDGMNYIDALSTSKIQRRNITLHEFRLPVYTALFLNPSANSVLNELGIRKALAYGINRNTLIQNILGGHGVQATGPLLPGFLGHSNDISTYPHDLEIAKKLLRDAGYVQNPDGYFYTKQGHRLVVHLQTTDWSQNVATANAVADAWKAIGVECKVQTFTVSEIQQTFIRPRKFEILLFSQNIGTDPDIYPFWHSSQAFDPGLNLSFLRDKDLDDALERARRTSDSAQRTAEYLTVQRKITDSVGAIFLFSQNYLYPTTKDLRGFDMKNISVPADRFLDAEKLFVKTKRIPIQK